MELVGTSCRVPSTLCTSNLTPTRPTLQELLLAALDLYMPSKAAATGWTSALQPALEQAAREDAGFQQQLHGLQLWLSAESAWMYAVACTRVLVAEGSHATLSRLAQKARGKAKAG